MRLLTLIVLLSVAAFTAYAADSKERVVTADTVALSFIKAYSTSDAETMKSLSVVPFSMDGDVFEVEDREFVDEFFDGIAEDMSEEEYMEYAVKRSDDVPDLDEDVFPEYAAFRLVIPAEGDYLPEIDMGMVIYISTGDGPKLIGFGFTEIEDFEE
jgi:hypothetical protein